MKKYLVITLLPLLFCNLVGQITFNFKTITEFGLDKFHVSGYKYVTADIPAKKIYMYNLNNSLYKTINIPATTYSLQGVSYISENLFDLDPGVEFIAESFNTSSGCKLYVFDESGATLFSRDSGYTTGTAHYDHIFFNRAQVYYDGSGVKMKVNIKYSNKIEVYNLPGSITCSGCSSGIVNSVASGEGTEILGDEASFYPNPTSDQLKLKYQLPPGWKSAKIKIYDINGKLVEDFNITDFFDFIYLPTDYNNGMYLYSLIVDDKVIKNEKIVLMK